MPHKQIARRRGGSPRRPRGGSPLRPRRSSPRRPRRSSPHRSNHRLRGGGDAWERWKREVEWSKQLLRSISIGERQEGDFFIERAEALEAADIVGDFIQILFYEGVAKTFMLMMSFIQNAESVDRVIHVIAALYKMKARDAFWKLMNGFASKIKEDKLPQYLSLVSLTFDNESVPIDKIANAMKQAADAPDTVIAFFRAFK